MFLAGKGMGHPRWPGLEARFLTVAALFMRELR
jgi:hypothetical protein